MSDINNVNTGPVVVLDNKHTARLCANKVTGDVYAYSIDAGGSSNTARRVTKYRAGNYNDYIELSSVSYGFHQMLFSEQTSELFMLNRSSKSISIMTPDLQEKVSIPTGSVANSFCYDPNMDTFFITIGNDPNPWMCVDRKTFVRTSFSGSGNLNDLAISPSRKILFAHAYKSILKAAYTNGLGSFIKI